MSERHLPTIEQLEPAAREYCRLSDIEPDMEYPNIGIIMWRVQAEALRNELATRWALDVYVSQNANGETQTDLSSTGETQ